MNKEYDFTNAKRAHEVLYLIKLYLVKLQAEQGGGNYQTLMNEALRQFAQGLTLADVVRETIKQELHRI